MPTFYDGITFVNTTGSIQYNTKPMKKSAGIIVYKMVQDELQILLVHPGGPFWKNKDDGAWSIPKGESNEDEQPLTAAKREFKEETGFAINGNFLELTPLKQKSGKWIYAWAVEGDFEVADLRSNEFEMEWPPKSGKLTMFTEIDRGGWFNVPAAKQKIVPGQVQFIEELINCLKLKARYP